MFGPKPVGFWSKESTPKWDFLERGKSYEVIQEFLDHDGIVHPVGESWTFAGYTFLPYEEGLSLFVQTSAGEWHIRMMLVPEAQKPITDKLATYFRILKD